VTLKRGFREIEGFRPLKKEKESFLIGWDRINRVGVMDGQGNIQEIREREWMRFIGTSGCLSRRRAWHHLQLLLRRVRRAKN
jgi:hypothetical protein